MKKYEFKFQAILNLKKQLEKNLQNKLSIEQNKLNNAKQFLAKAINDRQSYIIDFEQGNSNYKSIMLIQMFYSNHHSVYALGSSQVFQFLNVRQLHHRLFRLSFCVFL